jgi:hypothetical protein
MTSLGAAARQACDLEGAGTGARHLSAFRILCFSIIKGQKKQEPQFLLFIFLLSECVLLFCLFRDRLLSLF